MNKLALLLGCVVASVAVALTYFIFELAVRQSIDFVWDDVFRTDSMRLLVIPLCVGIGLAFYGLQHILDPRSENHESHGVGGAVIAPTLRNLVVILLLGFLSLLAGASLGPEAVLVPASMVIGGYIGLRLFKKNTLAVSTLAAAGIMALMTSFFHSIPIGIVSVMLVASQAKTKVTPQLLVVAVIASVSAYVTLQAIDPAQKYFNFPPFDWHTATVDLIVSVLLVAGGYIATFALKYSHAVFVAFRTRVQLAEWWEVGAVAGLGLSALYLIGGPLVQFTGNESIAPLMSQAASLGMTGLVGIFAVKILAISWSKAMGYRGGLIFPMVFVATSLVAMVQIIFPDAHFGVALIAAMVGILAAERKAKILL